MSLPVSVCFQRFPEGGFSVNSPVFRKIVLHLPEGDVIIKGGDEKKEYIHSLSLDGKKMEGTWIDWSDLYRGRPWNINYPGSRIRRGELG